MYSIDDYDYPLPQTLIAQAPLARRGQSRLLYLQRQTGRISHHRFGELADLLDPSDLLVINDTRVIPARLIGQKTSGGKVELLILDYADPSRQGPPVSGGQRVYRCLIKGSKGLKPGAWLSFGADLKAQLLELEQGVGRVRFNAAGDFESVLERIGKVPLPPYIKRDPIQDPAIDDRQAYQTVYAAQKGAIAAPTAGLHFSKRHLAQLRSRGIGIVPVTLHVGYGTFSPVRVKDIRRHLMHAETFCISAQTAAAVNQAKAEGRRVVAVGTTSVRTLESFTNSDGSVRSGWGLCDLFIYPGFRFQVIDGLITNFHLPRSTLLMLVSAFAGRERILSAYQAAVERQYRFFSYGDAMLIG
jgi:S-adenosylmethionine:tRNA ribosyltransferase-isomerase